MTSFNVLLPIPSIPILCSLFIVSFHLCSFLLPLSLSLSTAFPFPSKPCIFHRLPFLYCTYIFLALHSPRNLSLPPSSHYIAFLLFCFIFLCYLLFTYFTTPSLSSILHSSLSLSLTHTHTHTHTRSLSLSSPSLSSIMFACLFDVSYRLSVLGWSLQPNATLKVFRSAL